MSEEFGVDKTIEQDKKEYHSEDFRIAEPYFDRLVAELLPAIRSHEYSTIVGDDSSGRVATLVLRKFIAEAYKRDGVESPKTIFYAGGYTKDPRGGRDYKNPKVFDAIAEDFKKVKKDSGKVLIVTEYIIRGATMDNLVFALAQSGAECEVATLAMAEGKDKFLHEHNNLQTLIKTKIISGGEITPDKMIPFYNEPEIAGVKKEWVSKNIHTRPLGKIKGDVSNAKEITKNARIDAKHLAEKLISEYL